MTLTTRFTQVLYVANVTAKEILRDRVLYNVIILGFGLVGLSALLARLSFVDQQRILLDFGFLSLSASAMGLAILSGAPLLSREIQSRTIFVSLSRPIDRWQFLLGKWIGLNMVVSLNAALMLMLLLGLFYLFGVSVGLAVFVGFLMVCIQAAIMSAVVIMFSALTTVSLSVVFSVASYIIGSNVSQLRGLAERLENNQAKIALDWACNFLPNLEYFQPGFNITYDLPTSTPHLIASVGYGGAMVLLSLFLSSVFFHWRTL